MSATSDTIASLVIKLGLDARDVQTGLSKSEQQITGFAGRAGAAMRVAGGMLGAGLGLAAKGSLEMEDRAARFVAETGASADEAAHFADVVNATAGRSLVSLDAIAESATKIRTDLGLVGTAADQSLQAFVRYERATNQGAAAVLAFDDILDAWNLDASEAPIIMDALVASHQRYGGAIEDNQRLLADLAPALQAANMSWQEGLGLLNLFARAGVSGEAATTAFNRALTQVDSPEELRQLLEDISAIEDPFERAQKAAEVFGARAGTKLGQALGDAHGDLSVLEVDLKDVAGATEKAASALDDTISSKFKLALNQASSMIRGFGMEVGPILTGAFAAVNLAGALGLDKLWAKAGGPSAKAAAKAAGAAVGLAYRAAAFVANAFIDGIVALWGLMGGPRVLAAAGVAGTAAGGAYAAAASAASAAAAKGGATGAAVGLGRAAAGASVALAPAAIGSVVIDAVIDQPVSDDPKVQQFMTLTGTDMVAGIQKSAQDAMGSAVDFFGLRNAENEQARQWRDMAMGMVTRGTEGVLPAARKAGEDLALSASEQMAQIHPTLFKKGSLVEPVEDEFAAARQAILQGFGSIKEALKKGAGPQLISKHDRLENMEGRMQKVMKNLRRAVEVNDPINIGYWTKAAAKQAAQIDRMRGKSSTSSKDIARKFDRMGVDVEGSWKNVERRSKSSSEASKDAAVGAAQKTSSQVSSILGGMNLAGDGRGLIGTWVAGILSAIPAVVSAANQVAAAFAAAFKTGSPPKEGPLHTIDQWGPKLVDVWAGPLERHGVKRARRAAGRVADAFRPAVAMPVAMPLMAAMAGAGSTYQIGTLIANDSGIDELDRRMDRRRRLRGRGAGHYNDPN